MDMLLQSFHGHRKEKIRKWGQIYFCFGGQPPEVGSLEDDSPEVGPAEGGPEELPPVKVNPLEVGPAEI
jgi:hypothetical protein